MGKILPSFFVEEAETQTKYIYVFGGEYQKMATDAPQMHLSAVLQNGSARWNVRRVGGEMQVLGDFPSIQRNEM